MYRHLLVPIDGTDLSTEICTNAVEFAYTLGARITFFHAQPDYAAALDGDAEILRLTSPEKFAYAYTGRVRELLAKAEAAARAFGVESRFATVVNDSPAQAIIAAAHESHCDLIYMASHGRRSHIGMMLGSQTLKVLVSAGMPVLVARTSTSAAPSLATDLIRDEHRSLAAVLHALLNVLDSGQDLRNPPHADLLRTIASYIETFPGTQHRPKEEEYILPRLEARSSRYGHELAELKLQHEQGRRLANELTAAVERYLASGSGLAAMKEVVSHCEQSLWEHMRLVERVILPAALRHLTPEDWDEINAAFSEGADPRFGRNSRTEFRHLFSRIVNLASEKATELCAAVR